MHEDFTVTPWISENLQLTCVTCRNELLTRSVYVQFRVISINDDTDSGIISARKEIYKKKKKNEIPRSTSAI